MFSRIFGFQLSESNSQTACCDFRKSGQMAARRTKMACAVAFPYKVSVMEFTVGTQQSHRHAGWESWEGPTSSALSQWGQHIQGVSNSPFCASYVCPVFVYGDESSMFRLIPSTGCPLHSTFTLVFIWNFLSEKHFRRTVSSVRNRRKKIPWRGAPARLTEDRVNCYGG